MSFDRKKGHKVRFLKKHKNFAENAFRDAVRLRGKGLPLNNSENISKFILLARAELKYSDKTASSDIFWGLMKIHHENLEKK